MEIGQAVLGTGFTFMMTALGAAVVFFFVGTPRPGTGKTLLGFAAGVMTAASVWSLLLPAIARTEAEGRFPGWLPASAGVLAGAAFLALLDAALPHLRRLSAADEGKNASLRQDALLITAITLHNIPEGMAVGLACALAAEGNGVAGAAALTVGIGIQNFPEGAAVSLPLRKQGRLRAFAAGALSGAVEPLFGIPAAAAAGAAETLMPWLLSFAAGAMLYVTAEELIPQAHSRPGVCGYVAGFLLMMALDTALG